MTCSDYLEFFPEFILTIILDIAIQLIYYFAKLRKQDTFKINTDFIVFIILCIVLNGLLSYIFGVIAYFDIDINDTPVFPYEIIWIIIFLVLCLCEGVVFIRMWMQKKRKTLVEISMTPKDYKELILDAEKDAKTIWLMPKRIHVMFKSEEFINYLAEKRFGVGSEYIKAYVEEHIERKAALYKGLFNGLVIHELHNKKDLISYIRKKSHHGVRNIEDKYFINMLEEWKRILEKYPNNYCVRLTNENIPLKYELIDNKKMVIHESVGTNSKDRLNAIFIENPNVVQKVSSDFLQVWERIPSSERSNKAVIAFIDNYLLPLLNESEK